MFKFLLCLIIGHKYEFFSGKVTGRDEKDCYLVCRRCGKARKIVWPD